MSSKDFQLTTGSRVAVIGGGPAGSFFALYLLHYGQRRGSSPEVTVYQARDFGKPGREGCKGCAGVLSISFLRNLEDIGLRIPEEIIQSKIDHYAVHSPYTSISISNPERDVQIVSVFRGGGPRLARGGPVNSFDGWLLRQVRDRGARVEHEMVSGINLGPRASIDVGGEKREYDLVVMATGVNAPAVPVRGLGYVAPRTRVMSQDELYAGTEQVEARLGSTAHAFLIPKTGLIFGTLVPKGPYISVSVFNSDRGSISVSDFLKYDMVRETLPETYERTCGCAPRTTVSPARNYFADRFAVVGDAAVSRLYKDGIGSSLLTARQAAFTAIHHGISRHDFKRHYEPFCNRLKADNRWGRFLFSVNNRAKNSRSFLLMQHRLIGDEQRRTAGTQAFTKAAWGMFTGSYGYGAMARMIFKPSSLGKLAAKLLGEGVNLVRRRKSAPLRKLHVGATRVLILGSGFGGAYVLRTLVPALNLNENVETTMISDENFFLFSPLLHEVAMGRIESRHVAYPIRRLQWRDRFNFIQASVNKIDLHGQQVATTAGVYGYDYLVLALGGVSDMSGLANVEENKNVFTLKTLYDSRLIRNHIIKAFERASIETGTQWQKQLLTFVISGAGYIGVQTVTELRDFIFRSLSRYYKAVDTRNIRILLVEKDQKIISNLHTRLGAYAFKQLQKMGIEVRFRSRLTRVWEDRVEINNREIIPTHTIIWLSGEVSSPRIAEIDAPTDDIGRVIVDDYLEVPGYPHVYALGDCAHFKDKKTGEPAPRRAHIAVRQARVVTRNILAEIRGRDKKPYPYSRPPELVSLGVSKAMFRFRGLRIYGLPARFMWLGVYSLLVMGTYNRVRILMDWTSALVFGRDTSYIKTKIGKSGQ